MAQATISSAIGDIILQITRPGSIFKFTDLSLYSEGAGLPGGVPDAWGSVSLDPFVDETNPAGWIMTAILPLGYAVLNTSAQLGDFSPSDKDEFGWDGELVQLPWEPPAVGAVGHRPRPEVVPEDRSVLMDSRPDPLFDVPAVFNYTIVHWINHFPTVFIH